MSETLLYAVVPDFYAEVERAADPELIGRPVIVGGDPRKRGLVQSASVEARSVGVVEGMTVLEALDRCPEARALKTGMRRYREVGARLRACFRHVTSRFEPVGLGGAYLDLPAAGDPPETVARDLAKRVADELHLPLAAGIAPAKFLARLAAEESGTSRLRRLRAADVDGFLRPLPVSRLPGVGPNTEEILAEIGARTVNDLLGVGRRELETRLGNHGLTILAYAEGRDVSRLRIAPHPRSLSQESTLDADETDRVALETRLGELAQSLEAALAREELVARRVMLRLRYADRENVTRTHTLSRPVRAARQIRDVGSELLGRTQAGERPVRWIGLSLGLLGPAQTEDTQPELF